MQLFAGHRRHWAFRSAISRPSNKPNELHSKHIVAKRQSYALNHSPRIRLERNPMRNVARIKLGYYPLPPDEESRLRQLLNYPSDSVSVLDPCAGTGAALFQLTDNADTNRYAVELDAERARQAKDAGIDTVHANIFDVT